MLLNKKKFIFVSPHSKKIGESYVLPKLVKHNLKIKNDLFYLFNSCGEWDNLEYLQKHIIENKFRFIINFAPNIEKLSPWLNYRIWLIFASISILFGLTYSLHFEKKIKNSNRIVVARMATSITSLVNLFKPHHTKFIVSMAGVPKINLFRKLFWPIIYLNYKKIVTPSKLMIPHIQKITKNYNSNQYHFIENPVLDKFNSKLFEKNIHLRKLKIYVSQHQWRILYVGRLTRQKGLDLLIKSLVGIKFNYTLDIIGEGENLNSIKKLLSRHNLNNSVNFLGFKTNPFKHSNNYDFYVMPSRWEGPGHTIIEALSHGLPSIVSSCNFGPQETIGFGKYGVTFETEDVSDLTNKIIYMIKNYKKYIDKTYKAKKFLSNYTVEKVYSKWNDTF